MAEKIRSITLEVPAPTSLNILDDKTREEIVQQAKKQVIDDVTKLVERAVQKSIARKLNLATEQPKRTKEDQLI